MWPNTADDVMTSPDLQYHHLVVQHYQHAFCRPDEGGRNQSSSQKDKSGGPTCKYCKKPGHVLSNCYSLKRKRESRLHLMLIGTPLACSDHNCDLGCLSVGQCPGMSEGFVSDEFVSLIETLSHVPIKILMILELLNHFY